MGDSQRHRVGGAAARIDEPDVVTAHLRRALEAARFNRRFDDVASDEVGEIAAPLTEPFRRRRFRIAL